MGNKTSRPKKTLGQSKEMALFKALMRFRTSSKPQGRGSLAGIAFAEAEFVLRKTRRHGPPHGSQESFDGAFPKHSGKESASKRIWVSKGKKNVCVESTAPDYAQYQE